MSWSFTLQGPVSAVKKELADAKRVLESAIAHLEGHAVAPKDTVTVSCNGHASWNDSGEVTGSATGHQIGVTPYRAPEPVEMSAAPDEKKPAEWDSGAR